MTLRSKILLAELPLAACLALVGFLSVGTISSLGQRSDRILRDNYRSVLAAQQMKESIERIDSAALFVLIGERESAMQEASPHRKRFEEELRAQEGNISETGEQETTDRLRQRWQGYQSDFDRLLTMEDLKAAKGFYLGTLRKEFLAIKEAANDVLALNEDAIVRKSNETRAAAKRMDTIMVGVTLGAFLLGIIGSVSLTNRVLGPVGVLSLAVRRLGEGDLQARASISGVDEIAQLAAEFNSMAERLQEYRSSSLGELLQAQQASQATIDSLPDPVIVFGLGGEVLNVNRAAESIPGLSLDPGKERLSLLDPNVRSALDAVRSHVLGGKGAYAPKGFEESIRIGTAGGDRYLLPRAAPVYDERETIVGATMILRDVTRLRRFDELKNDLVATVAHEFRTPLISLRMAIHLCLDESLGSLAPKHADLLYAAREDCERLQLIVDDLLNLSRIQSGAMELHPRPVAASALMKSACGAYRDTAHDKGVNLHVERTLDEAGNVLADADRVQLVFSNLIANAVQHTPRGGSVEVRAKPQGSSVRFEVVDTGEGIPIEHQRRLFEKFFRVPGSTHPGAGLGLAIAKDIVLAHKGEIGVESGVGRGSSFWFTLARADAV
jgi:PAS domain S-box-containing protein